MTTLRTARERARSEVSAEILTTAREHLAIHGRRACRCGLLLATWAWFRRRRCTATSPTAMCC